VNASIRQAGASDPGKATSIAFKLAALPIRLEFNVLPLGSVLVKT